MNRQVVSRRNFLRSTGAAAAGGLITLRHGTVALQAQTALETPYRTFEVSLLKTLSVPLVLRLR